MRVIKFSGEGPKFYFDLDGRGNSDAVLVPVRFTIMTVMLGGIQNGNATVEYCLSDEKTRKVEDDTANWYPWSLGAVTSNHGMRIDSPINYLRVVTSANDTAYTLELLSD